MFGTPTASISIITIVTTSAANFLDHGHSICPILCYPLLPFTKLCWQRTLAVFTFLVCKITQSTLRRKLALPLYVKVCSPVIKYYIKSYLPPLPCTKLNSLFLRHIRSIHDARLYTYTLFPFPKMLSFLVVHFHYPKNYFTSWEIIIFPSGCSLENLFL